MEEENKSDCVSTLYFLSAHDGFRGSIKNYIRDFVVIEIDINGQLVNAPGSKLSQPLSDNNGQFPHHEPKSDKNPVTTDDYGDKNISTSDDRDIVASLEEDPAAACEESFDLNVCLDDSVTEELEKFAAGLKSCSEPKPSELTGSDELSLGTFPDKHRRACVHRAVRHNFPFLMTLTNKTEILVKEDPNYKELSRLVSEEESLKFLRFIDEKVPNSLFTFRQDESKGHRKTVHHFISKRFGKLVETKSFSDVASSGLQTTAITVRLRERSNPPRKRAAADRQEEDVVYTAFTLRKENLETLEAVSFMAAAAGVLPSDFTYAGMKDKRAVTYQSMVVKKVSTERLKEMSPGFERKGINLSHIRPVSQPLRLGWLLGNHFDLIVRGVRAHGTGSATDVEQLVREAVENVKAKGFVNYYGPQRFGTGQGVQADQVGLALLKQEMVMAVRLFFTPEEGDDPQNTAKRHFLQTGDAKESLSLMPAHKTRERMMLRALHRYGPGPEGCTKAWLSIPHGMRVFYLHAYCSRVWNDGATFRLQQLGLRAVQGDLVWERREQEQSDQAGPPQVHVVTSAEEADNVYSIGQVVLPMPGNSVKYPENTVGTWYRERLASDGLESRHFRVTPLKLNIPGCYRPLLAHPRNLTHQLGKHPAPPSGEEGKNNSLLETSTSPSLALSFDLDSSCYATVCLKEIMKCDP